MKKWISLSLAALFLMGCQKLDKEIEQLKRVEEEYVLKVKTVNAYQVMPNANGVLLEVSGVLKPRQELSLSFGTSGRIASIQVQKGNLVKEGQTLATLDGGVWQQEVSAAMGQVASANVRRNQAMQGPKSHEVETQMLKVEKAKQVAVKAGEDHRQAKLLYDNGAISKDELDRVALAEKQANLSLQEAQVAYNELLQGADQLDVEAANASLQQANVQLNRARQEASEAVLKAPFSGVVAAISQAESEQTGPGSEVIRLVDTSQWLVDLQVESEQIASWQQGAAVTVKSADGTQAQGTVTFVSPVVDEKTGTYPVEVTIAGSDVNWRGGMTVTCAYPLQADHSLLVPVNSVGVSDEGYYVMKINEQVVKKTPVKVGAIHGAHYEILEGLEQGDTILASGLSYVVDGEVVRVEDE
ncbi:RND transporter [Brevibacillus panacihumi W25]|uniref:RND transporter n=1 Tax=Brevibacillus panacihumi W25 TaxID=1408254 RepID=V6M501_9BACL|nr:efflux RND transporter periplasmic adaptor subunit [Brevibacillus panacihumi]EST53671.1 RND transporter [Brevibacillus panacihumi W25]